MITLHEKFYVILLHKFRNCKSYLAWKKVTASDGKVTGTASHFIFSTKIYMFRFFWSDIYSMQDFYFPHLSHVGWF